jgi:hypothetical protein
MRWGVLSRVDQLEQRAPRALSTPQAVASTPAVDFAPPAQQARISVRRVVDERQAPLTQRA